ncbi:MAG: hypothetical protein ABIQ93_09675 [Saprospiraceae bacterium]
MDTDQQILVDHGQTISLDFFGPFKFIKGEFYLFESAFVKSEGIYIWTIKDEKNNQNFVHYVGETVSFGKRQKEHLIQITGLNYRIIDADLAKQGIEKIIWNGMWRDRTPNAVATLLDNYTEVSKKVVDYIGLINVYFAATTLEKHLRKHIEGCLGWNFRNNYPDHKTMYPDDNYVGIKAQRLGKNLLVNLPEEIVGIDREQII